MADSLTVANLITRIRALTGITANRMSDANLILLIDDAYHVWYDICVSIDPSRFITTTNLTIVSGTRSYSLPADYYWFQGAEVEISTNDWHVLGRFNWNGREDYTTSSDKLDTLCDVRKGYLVLQTVPSWGGTIRVQYCPIPSTLTLTSSTIDGINRWHNWIIYRVCQMLAITEEDSNVRDWGALAADIERRMVNSGDQNKDRPKRLTGDQERGIRRYFDVN